MRYEAWQVSWILLPYLWEVPVLGIGAVLLPVWLWLRPLERFSTQARPEEAGRLRRIALDLPLRLVPIIVLTSLFGYLLGAAQAWAFARMPLEELVKAATLGLPTGLLYALLAYFVLADDLRPVLERCEELAPESPVRPRLSLFWKVWACLLVISVVCVTMAGLVFFALRQDALEEQLADRVLARADSFAQAVAAGQAWTAVLEGRHGDRSALLKDRRLVVYFGPPGEQAALAADAARARGGRGSLVLRDGATRVLGWTRLPDGSQVLAEVRLWDYAGPLYGALRGTLLGWALAVALAALLASLLAGHLARPLNALMAVSTRVPRTWPAELTGWFSDDEVGALGRAFRRMLAELRRAQEELVSARERLEHLLRRRTRSLRKTATLLAVSRAISSSLRLGRVMDLTMAKVRQLCACDACSIMLPRRQTLVMAAASGLRPHRQRPLPLDRGFVGQVFHSGEPRQIVRQPGQSDESFPRRLKEEGLHTALAVPIRGQGTSLGVINVYRREALAFSPAEIDLLVALGRQAARAIRNASRYEGKRYVHGLLRQALTPQEVSFPGVQVGHLYRPSAALAGDFYALIPLGARCFGVVMADVSGKGPDAAIWALRLREMVASHALGGHPPGKILELLNRQTYTEAFEHRMVTVFYGEVDLDRRLLTFASAGHEPVLLWQREGGEVRLLSSGGIVVGAVADATYLSQEVELPPGSCLLLYTDGVTEARMPGGECFTLERLLALVQGFRRLGPQELVEAIHDAARRFSQGHKDDDLSLLALAL
jgi:sigma-B regulation protein RsbU (phosphoserine phosphatase)